MQKMDIKLSPIQEKIQMRVKITPLISDCGFPDQFFLAELLGLRTRGPGWGRKFGWKSELTDFRRSAWKIRSAQLGEFSIILTRFVGVQIYSFNVVQKCRRKSQLVHLIRVGTQSGEDVVKSYITIGRASLTFDRNCFEGSCPSLQR